jgi:HNH endonuclease
MPPVTPSKNHPESLPPIGLCGCWCGGRTALARSTNLKEGRLKGQPLRFLPGHQNRKRVRAIEEDRRYETLCLTWRLAKNEKGYGIEKVGGKRVLAHRAAYERVYGEIEDELELDHLCRQPDCVRVDHLEPVTHRENLRRGSRTKLARAEVITIRRDPRKQGVIAEEYGISQSQVSRIKRGASWADVPEPDVSTHDDPPRLPTLDGASEEPRDQAQPDLSISKLAA